MKRIHDEAFGLAAEPQLRSALASLLKVPEDEAEAILAERIKNVQAFIAVLFGNSADLTPHQYKKAKLSLPCFSAAKWDDVAGQHGLPQAYQRLRTGGANAYSAPTCYLAPSFHRAVFQNGWRVLDVYQESEVQTREAARVRTLEPFLVAVMAIFRGRIIDKPESPMRRTLETSGGEVVHEILAAEGALFFVVELKLLMTSEQDHVAQLFLEMLSAAEENADIPTNRQLRIHGLLTDLSTYHFYSYDPVEKKFAFDLVTVVSGVREEKLGRMIPVTNKIFSILLAAYIGVLKTRAEDEAYARVDYPNALALANEAHTLFTKKSASKDELETQANKALTVLQQSISIVPREAQLTSELEPEPVTADELERVADRWVDRYCLRALKPS
ncbi:hypothetical protein OE88DRAFT_1651042 [Heliocybe sulcata]|uniref:Uncharacterized protein n=1 Tax=Heliocybe sulcata TaxID=5364 RepID=A0A5C3NIZ1_9AGAM|nr:hypothetical protein OE88DRAFT_1651042 [Heliocybe sulcata]